MNTLNQFSALFGVLCFQARCLQTDQLVSVGLETGRKHSVKS